MALVLPFALRALGLHLPLWARLAMAGVVVIPMFAVLCIYWRSIGEPAREAQKWAWYWGGSIGMAVGCLAMAVVFAVPPLMAAVLPTGLTPAHAFFHGAIAMVAVQGIGFVGAWIWWWWGRR